MGIVSCSLCVDSNISQSEKKQKAWYYASMYPSYKTRKSEFKSLFPDCYRFKFVVDYSCAYHKVIQLVMLS